jgi:hypothetical protein
MYSVRTALANNNSLASPVTSFTSTQTQILKPRFLLITHFATARKKTNVKILTAAFDDLALPLDMENGDAGLSPGPGMLQTPAVAAHGRCSLQSIILVAESHVSRVLDTFWCVYSLVSMTSIMGRREY